MTGTLFAPVLKEKIARLNQQFGTKLYVEGVENHYFGGDVSVAGLLTGSDFVKAAEKIHGDCLIIPRSTLKSDEEIMLDGMTLTDLQERVGVPVHPLDMRAFAEWLS
jgi:NifB/MoaA-like Fe-S oxidoreductase